MNVPFTWRGSGGNSQMIAGGENYPIYFTNLIFGNSLYTITYRWPGVNGFTPALGSRDSPWTS